MCQPVAFTEKFVTLPVTVMWKCVYNKRDPFKGHFRRSKRVPRGTWAVPVPVTTRNHSFRTLHGDMIKRRETKTGYHCFVTRRAADRYGAFTIPVLVKGRAIRFTRPTNGDVGYIVQQWRPAKPHEVDKYPTIKTLMKRGVL